MKLLNDNISLGAVILRVHDLSAMKEFYRNVLGMEVMSEADGLAILGIDGRELLHLVKGNDMVPSLVPHAGLFHLALLLPKENDLAAFLYHLNAVKYNLDGAGDHVFSQAFYMHDLEGNGIEIYADRPREDWDYEADGLLKAVTDPVDIDALIANYDGKPWNGLPKDTIMGHVHLSIKDLDIARKFYIDFLGMELKTELPTALFVAKDGYHHHLGMNTWGRVKDLDLPVNESGLISYEIKVDNLDEIILKLQDQKEYNYQLLDQGVLINDGNGIDLILSQKENN